MVETVMNLTLDMSKISNHTIAVQFLRLTMYCDNPIMAMQVGTFAGIREIETMTASNLDTLGDVIRTFKVFFNRVFFYL